MALARRRFVFVGVSTRSSAVVPLFGPWCEVLGVNWELDHLNIEIGAGPAAFENLTRHMRSADVIGSLVTSHKTSVFSASGHDFDLLEPMTAQLSEIGVIFKRDGELCGGVSDVRSGGHILREILSVRQWIEGDGSAIVMGGGGAGLAAAWNLAVQGIGGSRRVVLVEADPARLETVRNVTGSWPTRCPLSAVSSEKVGGLLESAGRGCLVVNATGLGKDRPGSPLPAGILFPAESIIWEFNYRGSLDFWREANRQAAGSGLSVHDGFEYFASGWSVVMSRVAGCAWTPDVYSRFLQIATAA